MEMQASPVDTQKSWLETPEIDSWRCLAKAILKQMELMWAGTVMATQVNKIRQKTGEIIDPLTGTPVEGNDNPKLFRSLPMQQIIAFELFLPADALPTRGTPEHQAVCERSNTLVWEFLRLYNDMYEIVPFAREIGGHNETIEKTEKVFHEIEEDMKRILERQGRTELINVIEQFKREKEIIKRKVQETRDPSEEFAKDVKELENAINEHAAVRFTLQISNPLAREDVEPKTYEDLLAKYSGYLTKNWTDVSNMTSEERGLAAIHGITMLAQVADDMATPWWDFNRGILNPATQQLKAGKTEEEMQEHLKKKTMPHYVTLLKALKVNPLMIWYLYNNGVFFFTRFLKAYKSGKKHPHDPFWNLRVELAQKNMFDKPADMAG